MCNFPLDRLLFCLPIVLVVIIVPKFLFACHSLKFQPLEVIFVFFMEKLNNYSELSGNKGVQARLPKKISKLSN